MSPERFAFQELENGIVKKANIGACSAFALAVLFLITSCTNALNPGGGLLGQGQGGELSLAGKVTTLAGTNIGGSNDGLGVAAKFYAPAGIATDGAYLYVADAGNNLVRKVAIATGEVTTLAGSTTSGSADGARNAAKFCYPLGITTDGTDLYVADSLNNMIRKVAIATGEVTTLAGSTAAGSADGIGTTARFNIPYGIATDGTNLYVVDSGNNMIRKVEIATGEVTTLAGSTASGFADGAGSAARFNGPAGIATDGANLYVADTGNNMIRKVAIATGEVAILAGYTTPGSANGSGISASFRYPGGIATDGTNLYVADTGNNMIRKVVIRTSAVTTLAGSTSSGSSDGTGTSARFRDLIGLTTDGVNLYVADTGNNLIRRVE